MPISAYWSAPPIYFERPTACAQTGMLAVDYWGFYAQQPKAPVLEITAKRKRHNISDACAACRRSKVKCDELKPCRRCLRDGRRVACVSWRDGTEQSGTTVEHRDTLAGMDGSQPSPESFAKFTTHPVEIVPAKRRKVRKPDASTPTTIAPATGRDEVMPQVKGTEDPHRVQGLVKLEARMEHDQLKIEEASALLLAFADECRKNVLAQH